MEDKDFYTVEEAAQKMGVSKRSIEEAVKSQQLKGHKRFSKWYIFHQDLLEFIKTA